MPENPMGSALGLDLFPDIKSRNHNDTQRHSEMPAAKLDQIKTNNSQPEKDMKMEAMLRTFPAPNYNVHAFYYTWFGNLQFDNKYIHWDHPVLPHWDSKVAQGYPRGRHSPPDDIGANFYPALGAYSSRDPSVIKAHMQQLRTAAIGKT